MTTASPWVCLLRLSLGLTRARTAAGLSQKTVAQDTRVGVATLSRVENGEGRPQYRTMIALLDHYGVTGDDRATMIDLWEGAKVEREPRPEHAHLRPGYAAYIRFEEAARAADAWEASFIPGLLQTEPYARAVIDGVMRSGDTEDRDRRVKTRIDRQPFLIRPEPLHLTAIMDESALWRHVGGPDVMADQLRHLHTMASQPHITLRVIPYTAGAHPGMPGSFTLLTFPEATDPEIAYIDGQDKDLLSQDNLGRYTDRFATLRTLALDPKASLALIDTVMDTFKEYA